MREKHYKRQETGCIYLDRAGVLEGDTYDGILVCENCPDETCRLDRNLRYSPKAEKTVPLIRFVSYVQCDTCKSHEEIYFVNGVLVETRKYKWYGEVFHVNLDGSPCGKCTLFQTKLARRGYE